MNSPQNQWKQLNLLLSGICGYIPFRWSQTVENYYDQYFYSTVVANPKLENLRNFLQKENFFKEQVFLRFCKSLAINFLFGHIPRFILSALGTNT